MVLGSRGGSRPCSLGGQWGGQDLRWEAWEKGHIREKVRVNVFRGESVYVNMKLSNKNRPEN